MYVSSKGPATAQIFIIGEAPGAEEERQLKPFCGPSGDLLNNMLREVGINRHLCKVGNVCKERPPGNDIRYFFEDSKKMLNPKPMLRGWIEELKQEIKDLQPNIIIALGDTALWALTGERGIMAARGYLTEATLVPRVKVLPTYHPAAVLRDWGLRFQVMLDLKKALDNSHDSTMPRDTRTCVTSISLREYLQYLQYLQHEHHGPISLDIETTRQGSNIDIVGIGESTEKAVAFRILNGTEPRFSPDAEIKFWIALADLLETKPVIMQNGKFDMASLWFNNRVLIKNYYFDTLIAAHVIWPEAPRSLGFLTSICTNYPRWKNTSKENPLLYNAQDCLNTYSVYEVLKPEIEKNEHHVWTFQHEMSQNYPAAMMEIYGIHVDPVVQEQKIQETKLKIAQKESELNAIMGRAVNVKSPKQLSNLLYVDLKLPIQYKRRKTRFEPRRVTTEASALQKLARASKNPVLGLIMELKKLYKLMTFLDIKLSEDNTVHTCYNITGATMSNVKASEAFVTEVDEMYKSFARWSSSASIIRPYGSGNLQNQPKAPRKMMVPPPGCTIVQADYMQAEAVVVAYLINDQRLIEMFQKSYGMRKSEAAALGYDVHKMTAVQMFGVPIEEVTSDLRTIGKRIRHATNYSAGPGVLAVSLGISVTEAKRLLELYHESCPQLRIWQDGIQRHLQSNRVLENLFGRQHLFMGRWDDNLFRSAYSYIPQSTVGDLLNKALVRLYQRYGDVIQLYIQLHDAVYTVVPKDQVASTIAKMRECMLMPLAYKGKEFTIDVDFSIGDSWGDMSDIEWQDYVTPDNIPLELCDAANA